MVYNIHIKYKNPCGCINPTGLGVPLPVVAGNPYPWLRVRVSAGKGTGALKITRGVPVPITKSD